MQPQPVRHLRRASCMVKATGPGFQLCSGLAPGDDRKLFGMGNFLSGNVSVIYWNKTILRTF